MPEEVIDGEVEEVGENGAGESSREVVPASPTLTVAPQVGSADLVVRLDSIRDAQERAMKRDVDYGNIPGTDKPTLLKPGAEKLGVMFQLDVQIVNEKTWGPGDHLTVVSHATVFHAPTGSRLGYGEGVCTTRERKYAYRQQMRTCPNCGAPSIIKGKQQYGGGWLCWKKKDGCGKTFPDAAPEIVGQEVGEIENPDLPDLWNTIVKMAEKRARVDAVLAVTGASALFTQDAEDAIQPAERLAYGPKWEAGDRDLQGAVARLLGESVAAEQTAVEVIQKLEKDTGYLPEVVGAALYEVAKANFRLSQPAETDVPADTEGLGEDVPDQTDPADEDIPF